VTDVTTSDGVRLYTEATGSGLVDALSGTFRCITYASRGYPPSEVPPEQERYNYLRQADDAIDVLDAFGIARAHVVGLSMGGFCVLQLGIRYPGRVSSLLVASPGSWPSTPPKAWPSPSPGSRGRHHSTHRGSLRSFVLVKAVAAELRRLTRELAQSGSWPAVLETSPDAS
jgi:pimeloyl-ACP methyl ester carboxylesterase